MPPNPPEHDAARSQADGRPVVPWWRRLLPYLGRSARGLGANLGLGVLVAAAAQLLLELARTGWDWVYVRSLLEEDAAVLATGAGVLLVVVLLLAALTGRMWLSATGVLAGSTALGVASHLKYGVRREPLYPRDLAFLAEPGFLLEMAKPGVLWLGLLGLLSLVGVAWGMHHLHRRRSRLRVPLPHWRPVITVSRVATVVVGAVLLSSVMQFNHAGNFWRGTFEAAGADWRKASQPYNYTVNGFLGAFLYNLDVPAMDRPDGYSRAAMQEIAQEYARRAQATNRDRTPRALEDVNVVSVLSESFSDPMRLPGLRFEEDPIAGTRALMQRLPHGSMLSPRIGGGTSSMEFEVLTGMSLAQFNSAMDTPFQMLIPGMRWFPSAVELFNQLGHTSVAIHPYLRSMYQRNQVYPTLGFSDFVDMTRMDHVTRPEDNDYIGDRAAFRQTLDTIERHEEPVFVNLVTMQNHWPYDGKYDDPVDVAGATPAETAMLGQYARGLTYSDRAVTRFIERLERSDEKTVVIFYGDHLPGHLPEEVFDRTPWRTMHETPFFLYANFGDVVGEQLPTTSPVFFMPMAFEVADAPVTPYLALLDRLRRHVSAMDHGRMFDPQGRRITPADLSAEGREVLRDYRMVVYDLSVGRRFAEQMVYPTPQGHVAASGTSE